MKKTIIILALILIFSGCGQTPPVVDVNTNQSPAEPGVVYLSFMVHVEGWDDEADNKNAFDRHSQAVKRMAKLFSDSGAKATFEFKPEFIAADQKYQTGVITELIAAGQGIGVHADVGGNVKEDLSLEEFTSQIQTMKENLEQASGQEILHVSGICSNKDWVKAAINAGYKFTTGTVGYCAMSLPQAKRPAEYQDCPNPAACHGTIPIDLADRLHPWVARTATNWLEPDPQGQLVILSSDSGIRSMSEEATGQEFSTNPSFTQEDIDVYLNHLEQAISLSSADQVNFLYPSLSIGSLQIDFDLYQKWLDQVQPYIDSGQAEWKTLPEIYQAYTD